MLLKSHIILLGLVHFSLWTAAPGWVKGFLDPISIILCPSPWEICLICNFQPTFHRCQEPQQDVFRGHVRKGRLNVRSWYEICNQLLSNWNSIHLKHKTCGFYHFFFFNASLAAKPNSLSLFHWNTPLEQMSIFVKAWG